MSEKNIAVYHKIMKRENFETAARDLFQLLVKTQKEAPDRPRILYVDIDGHRNEAGGFDRDMLELQKDFGVGFLAQFFQEVHFPLGSVRNTRGQNNDVPDKLQICNAENKKDSSLDELYIENYSNTEFMSEPEVYKYLKHLSDFLRRYDDWNRWCETVDTEKVEAASLMGLWRKHLNDIINELFNNFIHGNLLSAAAMTRTLIECYVYISILIKEQDPKLIEDWYLCSLMMKVKEGDDAENKILGLIKTCCTTFGRDFAQVYQKFYKKGENRWLSAVIDKKRITFHDACEYLERPEIYDDFQDLCSFVHGQDVYSKMMPFTFYSSICGKLYVMCYYIFESIRLFDLEDSLEAEIQELEEELWKLGEKFSL